MSSQATETKLQRRWPKSTVVVTEGPVDKYLPPSNHQATKPKAYEPGLFRVSAPGLTTGELWLAASEVVAAPFGKEEASRLRGDKKTMHAAQMPIQAPVPLTTTGRLFKVASFVRVLYRRLFGPHQGNEMTMRTRELAAEVAGGTRCAVIPAGGTYLGNQGLTYSAGISAETAGARGICLHLVTIPPGGRAKAHLHESHETAIYTISGEVDMWWGEGQREHLTARAGDFVYIPAGMPHLPVNASQTESCSAIISRTDPNEQESVVLLPGLDGPTNL